MALRDDLLAAARRATEVANQFEARKRLKLGYTRIDPALIASQANVTVMYRNLERLLGGFLREDGASGILVNADRPRGLVHMTCAHELGHFFMGHESSADETVDHGLSASSVEQQANHFAYSLLAPQWLVVATMKQKGWFRADLQLPSVLYQMSLRLGTSFTALVWSLSRLGTLTSSDAQRILATQPKRLKQEALGGHQLVDSDADVWVLDASDRDRILEPGPRDQFVFDLPNHAAAGHLWSVDELRSEGFALEPFVKVAREQNGARSTPVVVGGTGKTMRYMLVPDEHGDAASVGRDAKRQVIAVHETTPWAPDAGEGARFALSAETEIIRGGLSEQERERRFAEVQGNG